MDINDQRDYAEETANAAEMAREGMAELRDESLDAARPQDARDIGKFHGGSTVYGTKRKSFTAMSSDGICEILGRMEESGTPYPMELNHRDFWNFLIALKHLHDDSETADDLRDWAASFISGIGETFNVEMI